MWNGGRIENRWQPMSALTWCGPSSRSTSFIALKIGRSGQPVQKPGGRPCTTSASGGAAALGTSACAAGAAASGITFGARDRLRLRLDLAVALEKRARSLQHLGAGVFAGRREHVLAVQRRLHVGLAQDRRQVLLDEVGLAFLDQQHGALAGAKARQLAGTSG